jgi:ankyrin repeat protein
MTATPTPVPLVWEGDFPLHEAVLEGELSVVEGLLDQGEYIDAAVHVEEYSGVTPLGIAIWTNNPEMVECCSTGARN